jgi:hypothetical protein
MNVLLEAINSLEAIGLLPRPDQCWSQKEKGAPLPDNCLSFGTCDPLCDIASRQWELGMKINFEMEGINFEIKWYLEPNFIDKMAYETILEISEPTTIQDFNAYKREFEQRFPEANRTARQRSGRFWFNWIFGSMISFKYGDDVAKTIYDYLDHLNRQDRGNHMNLPTLYN